MLKAIHKKTKKLISANKIERDPSWMGTEKDEWIAPSFEIENYKSFKERNEDVKVSFVKAHKKENIPYIAHFRIMDKKAIPAVENESPKHKLSKEGIYEDLINNKITIYNKPIKQMITAEWDDIDFEYRLSTRKTSVIADVILTFKERDILYGKGIVFEIQLSPQNEEITEDRTYDRILEGYSVVWLWDGMFGKDNKLKNKNIEIIPYLKAIKDYEETHNKNLLDNLNDVSRKIDDSMYYKLKQIEQLISQKKLSIDKESSKIESLQEEYVSQISERLKDLTSESKKEIKEQLKKSYQVFLENINNSKEIVANLDYEKIVDTITQKEVDLIRTKLNEDLRAEIEKKVKDKMDSLIIKDILDDVIPKIEKRYEDLDGEIWCSCNDCRKKFILRGMEFEKGKAYCEICFGQLEDNWMKRYYEINKKRKKDDLDNYS